MLLCRAGRRSRDACLPAIEVSGQIVDAQHEIGPCPGGVEGSLYQLLGFVGPILLVLTALHGETDGHLLSFRRERV